MHAGTRLCLECHHEWDPTAPPDTELTEDHATNAAPPADAFARENPVATMERRAAYEQALDDDDPDAYEGAADVGEVLAIMRERWVGRRVFVHDKAIEATLKDITDTGYGVIEYGSGFSEELDPDEWSVIADVPAAVTDDDAVVEQIGETSLAVAAQIMRAAAASLTDQDGTVTISTPEPGWLPPDPDVLPIIEMGAAYAVASVAYAVGVTREQLTAIADQWLQQIEETHDKGANNGENTSDTASTTDDAGTGGTDRRGDVGVGEPDRQ